MFNSKMPTKQLYNEREAAEVLGISAAMLNTILDRYVFNDGGPRPPNVEFTSSDLLMISYWVETAEDVQHAFSMTNGRS